MVKLAVLVVPSGLRTSDATASVEVMVTTGPAFDESLFGNKVIETVAGAESVKPSFATKVKESVTVVKKFVVER